MLACSRPRSARGPWRARRRSTRRGACRDAQQHDHGHGCAARQRRARSRRRPTTRASRPAGASTIAPTASTPPRSCATSTWGTTRRLASGRVLREWELIAADKEIEVAPGVKFPAWTYNGRVPAPTLRCREGERLRIRFGNGSRIRTRSTSTASTRRRWTACRGSGPGSIAPGKSVTYEFDAAPFGLHLYHCHVSPLAEHIARGMYGAFIVDPRKGRPDADELVMVMNGFDTTSTSPTRSTRSTPSASRTWTSRSASSATSWCASTW